MTLILEIAAGVVLAAFVLMLLAAIIDGPPGGWG